MEIITTILKLWAVALQEAEGGTVFFDEVETLPFSIQTKILRFLQEKEYKPVGSNNYKRINVRIIAATNDNLEN